MHKTKLHSKCNLKIPTIREIKHPFTGIVALAYINYRFNSSRWCNWELSSRTVPRKCFRSTHEMKGTPPVHNFESISNFFWGGGGFKNIHGDKNGGISNHDDPHRHNNKNISFRSQEVQNVQNHRNLWLFIILRKPKSKRI